MLPPGVKLFINSSECSAISFICGCLIYWNVRPLGEFYARDLGTGNLEMLSRFYEKYPDYADRTFLMVKVSLPGVSAKRN